MDISFSRAKERANLANHKISLAVSSVLLAGPHIEKIDDRFEYGEERLIATGLIGGRVHVCVYTIRGETYWIISLRRATRRETDDYYQSQPRRG